MLLDREAADREFPSRRHGIHFNHAAVAPLPARAAAALAAHGRDVSERGSMTFPEQERKVEELRGLAARLMGAGDGEGGAASVAIVANTSTGLNLVAQGLSWEPGDEVVTTESEFPANLMPWLALAQKGVVVRRVPTRDGAFTVEDVERHLTPRTRLVCVSAVAFHTGFVAPCAGIGALCRSRGVAFGIDAIQALGAVPVDVEAFGLDFLSADGHKWLLGPEGCGVLWTRPSFRERLAPPAGWLNLARPIGLIPPDEVPDYRADARRFEPGALPMPGVHALAASIGLLLELGLDQVGERIARVHAALLPGLSRLGFEPVLFDSPPRSGILSARPPAGKDARLYHRALEEAGIAASARVGLLRLSPHAGNDEEEAERVLSVLARA